MNKKLLNILKFLFFLGLGAVLIWLALKDKSPEELHRIGASIKNANFFWIILSLVISGFSHFFRSLRWRLMIEPLGFKTGVLNTFFAVMIGYLTNLAILRAGEVARCGMLTRYEKVPFVEGFGTVIAERAIDMICLIVIFLSILGLEFEKISGIAHTIVLDPVSAKMHLLLQKKSLLLVLGMIAFIFLAALWYFRAKIRTVLSGKVGGFVKGLWDGLLSTRKVSKPSLFFIYTALIWLMYILQADVCFFAFPETRNIPFVAAMVIVVFGSLGVIFVPGGTGAYQIIVVQILASLYLIPDEIGNAYAWAVWVAQIAMILFLGFMSLVLLPLFNKEAVNSGK
ncbi:MAG: lysylphosphatidylglycerol synthase transmembrane domain-containing protein [Bacteroidia bacterium]